MTILNLNTDVLPFLELSLDDSFGNVSTVHDYIEQFVLTYTNRNLESASYKEVYRTNATTITVKNRPIISIEKISLDKDNVINIKNSNVGTTALVTVTDTGVNFNLDGTTTSLTFASNATMSDMVTAINLLGNGWIASLSDTAFSTFLSTELLKTPALETINNTAIDLQKSGQSLSEYEIDEDNGFIFLEFARFFNPFSSILGLPEHTHPRMDGFHHVVHNPKVYISYTAGYSSGTIPNDLKTAMLVCIKYVYERVISNTLGVKQFATATLKTTFEGAGSRGNTGTSSFPNEALSVFNKYREIQI